MAAGGLVITVKIAFTGSAAADTDYQIDHFTQGVISVDVETTRLPWSG